VRTREEKKVMGRGCLCGGLFDLDERLFDGTVTEV